MHLSDDDGRESEGTQSSKEASYDVNGNPVEAGTHNNKLTSSINTKYCSSSTTSTANHKNRFSGEGAHNASGFPKRLDSFNKFDHNGVPVSELEDMPAGSTTADVSSRSGRKSWRRAQKEREEARKYPAKNIPGNRGNDKIEDLVSFVENTEEKKGTGGTQNGSVVGSYQNQVSQLNVEVISTKNLKKTKPILNRSKGCTALKDMKEKGGGSEDSSERGEDSGSGKASECGDLREVVASEQSQLLTDTKSKLPSTKMEADSMALLTNHAMDLHTTAVTDAASTNMLPVFENDTFIFTDFDSVSQATEEEFKVVKRKKTPRPQAPFYYQDNYQYDYQAYSGPSEVVSCREEYVPCEDRGPRRSRPMVRSVTPPPTSTKPEKDYYYQEKPSTERAFSPSAFPALGGMSLPREGRRNSTGNAPSETSPDDSDMESVKSLPLAGGASGAKADGTVSPQGISPVVSYAKIAAAPKSSKAASVVQSVSANLVLKPASSSNDCCRRHSLPSLIDPPLAGDSEAVSTEIAADVVTPKVQVNSRPVDLTLENNESSNDSLETRPEHIYNDPSCVNNRQVVDKPKAVSQTDDISNAGVNSLGSSKVVGIALTDKGTSLVTRGNCEDSVSKCVAQPPSGCPKTTSSSSSNSTGVVSKASAGASLSEASASSTVKSSPATNQWSSSPLTSKSAILSSSVSQAQPSQPQQHHQNQQQQQQQQQQTQKSTNNKKQKNKSVVFLDRRSDQPALNLGISFGFDTKLESAGPVCEQLTAPSTMAREGGPTTVSLPSDLGISKPAGGPRPGLNGLVIPSCPAVLVSAENSFTIESTLTQTEASVDDVKGTGDQPTTAPVNLVLANPAPVNTETNGPTQANTTASADPPKGLAGPTTNNKKRILNTLNLVPLKPSEDPNFHRGKFVVEDAAMFMKKGMTSVGSGVLPTDTFAKRSLISGLNL